MINERKTLDEIAQYYRTDKSSLGHNYTPYYELFFEPLRDKPISLCEIGIDEGASILTWNEYFPNATIFGLDIRDGYEYLHEKSDRIVTRVLDQSSEGDLFFFGMNYENEFDVLIDDGSHQGDHQILSFETLFLFLKPGGYYCIEDNLCSFDERWNKNGNIYDRIRDMVGEVAINGKMSRDFLCSDKYKQVSKITDLTYFERHIEWIFHTPGLVIIKKMK